MKEPEGRFAHYGSFSLLCLGRRVCCVKLSCGHEQLLPQVGDFLGSVRILTGRVRPDLLVVVLALAIPGATALDLFLRAEPRAVGLAHGIGLGPCLGPDTAALQLLVVPPSAVDATMAAWLVDELAAIVLDLVGQFKIG